MGIIYFLTVIALIILTMLIKKTDKRLNGISCTVITIVLLLCYNVFISYILNTIKIPINLLSLSIVNIVISIVITIYLFKKKQIQKYYIEKLDILYTLLMLIISLVVAYGIFRTYPFRIKYQTTDPFRHCANAIKFAEGNKLLRNNESTKVERPGAYINTGIAMKMFINSFERIDLYNVFVVYDIFILFITGLTMYIMMKRISKNKFLNFLAFLFSTLYVLGYPLNSMIFGWSYLSLSIPIINIIILMFEIFDNNEIDIKQWTIAVFLLNFAEFFSYYLFVPFLYGAEFLYFNIKSYKEHKKIFTKKNILLNFVTLILPTLISLIYFNFIIQIQNKGSGISSNIALFGYAYINIFTNMILLIPLSIYTLIKERKNSKFTIIMFILLLGYILLMKNYYIAWGLLFYLTYKGIIYLQEKNRYIPGIIAVIYVFLCLNVLDFSDIYIANIVMGLSEYADAKTVYTYDEIEFLKKSQEIIDYTKNVKLIGNEKRVLWATTLMNYKEFKLDEGIEVENIILDYENIDYIICFKRDYEDEMYNNRKCIYEDDQGIILRKEI